MYIVTMSCTFDVETVCTIFNTYEEAVHYIDCEFDAELMDASYDGCDLDIRRCEISEGFGIIYYYLEKDYIQWDISKIIDRRK